MAHGLELMQDLGQERDEVAVDTEPAEGSREPGGPLTEVGVRSSAGALTGVRVDVTRAEDGGAIAHDRPNGQREVLHRAPHGAPPTFGSVSRIGVSPLWRT